MQASHGGGVSCCGAPALDAGALAAVHGAQQLRSWARGAGSGVVAHGSAAPRHLGSPRPGVKLASNHLILCCPLLLLPSIFPSIRVFSNESVFPIRWPKYWSFSFSISPSNEYPGLFSFRMGWFDLLAVQGTLKSLLQHYSSKASILRHSAFFIVQLSHPYMTTGKTTALTRQNFVDKVMSLLFNMLSRLVITFLPRSKPLLISWLQSPSAVIFGGPKIRVSHCFPIYLP